MNKITTFSVNATPETALKKLSKANIEVFNLKKSGSQLLFGVRDINIKKVFAIFAHPCYNVSIQRKSHKNAFVSFTFNRFGLLIGGAIFLTAVALSNQFIFKISVTGSGSYLTNDVLAIMRSEGVSCGSFYKGMDKPLIQSRIMSLPSVTFCSVSKQGSVIIVDVQVDEEHSQTAKYTPLKSGACGVVRSIVAICGTAEAEVGQTVDVGTTLIGAYELNADGVGRECLAVGYAQIEISAHVNVAAEEDNEKNLSNALSSVLLYSDEIVSREYSVKTTSDGVIYEIDFKYLQTYQINMQ